jgi:hypothetical protein
MLYAYSFPKRDIRLRPNPFIVREPAQDQAKTLPVAFDFYAMQRRGGSTREHGD